jgi:ribonuclease inhibitor
MRVVILDGSQFTNQEVFHEIVSQQLDFPDYYGRNLDALWDCLTEVELPLKLVWRNFSDSQKFLHEYADKAVKVFADAQEELDGFSFEVS